MDTDVLVWLFGDFEPRTLSSMTCTEKNKYTHPENYFFLLAKSKTLEGYLAMRFH